MSISNRLNRCATLDSGQSVHGVASCSCVNLPLGLSDVWHQWWAHGIVMGKESLHVSNDQSESTGSRRQTGHDLDSDYDRVCNVSTLNPSLHQERVY